MDLLIVRQNLCGAPRLPSTSACARYSIFLALAMLLPLLSSCRTPSSRADPQNTELPPGTLSKMTGDEYDSLPGSESARVLKFVAFVDGTDAIGDIYFIDPRVHKFHHEYLATLPQYAGYDFQKIKAISHKSRGRQVYLGAISHEMFSVEAQWTFHSALSLTTEELLSSDKLKMIYDKVQAWRTANLVGTVGANGPLVFRPLIRHEATLAARAEDYTSRGIQIAFNEPASAEQVYSVGVGFGQVQIYPTSDAVSKAIESQSIDPRTILIIGEDLTELPPVNGIISAVPLTEASHLVFLAHMYGIPLVYAENALERFKRSQGRLGVLQTAKGIEGSFEFYDRLTQADVDSMAEKVELPSLSGVRLDLQQRTIARVDGLRHTDLAAYGGKAVGYGHLRRTAPDDARKNVAAIPIWYFKEFQKTATMPSGNSLDAEVKAALAQLGPNPTYFQASAIAKKIMDLFRAATPDETLIAKIQKDLQAIFVDGEDRVKLRSSSNVEDGPVFNGAGLYESKGVCLRVTASCTKRDFAKDLIYVWSSLYTPRGLWARLQFGVDEAAAGMGVVVNESFKGEIAQGVIKFGYRDSRGRPRATAEISAVEGEGASVERSRQGGLNEVLKYTHNDAFEDPSVGFHGHRPALGYPQGRRLMADRHYLRLVQILRKLHDAWPDRRKDMEIESEWKLMKEGGQEKIYVKQVRQVPAPRKFHAPKGFVFYPGSEFEMVAAYPENAYSILRPTRIRAKIARFSQATARRQKILVSSASVDIDGKTIPVSLLRQSYEEDEYGSTVLLTFGGPELVQPYTVNLEFSKEAASPIFSPDSKTLRISLTYENRVEGFGTSRFWLFLPEDVAPYMEAEARPLRVTYDIAGCSIKVVGTSSEFWVGAFSDDQIRGFDRVTISGVLARPLTITAGYPASSLRFQMHETYYQGMFDLWRSDANTSEIAELRRRRIRYLYIRGWYGPPSGYLDEKLANLQPLEECPSGLSDVTP